MGTLPRHQPEKSFSRATTRVTHAQRAQGEYDALGRLPLSFTNRAIGTRDVTLHRTLVNALLGEAVEGAFQTLPLLLG